MSEPHCTTESRQPRMSLVEALRVVADLRQEQIVVSTMGSAREWLRLSRHELDFAYLPSSMGQAPLIALGLALAQPRREVLAFNGDGCMLMNLGALVTIANAGATNLSLIVIENGVYEVTGSQRTCAGPATDFAGMARAAGFASVAAFHDLTNWRQHAAASLALPGPRCIVLAVAPLSEGYQLPTPEPMPQRITSFMAALGVTR